MNPTPKTARIAELSEFNYQTLEQPDLDALCTNDRAILDQSAYWAYGREFKAGDAIVQMAVHVIVKEMPNEAQQPGWTFQTFWWADRSPDGTSYGAKRPSSVKPGYFMMVDAGLSDPEDPSKYAPHFNPYIEPVIHPVKTSCLNCHVRGGWPSKAYADSTGTTLFSKYQLSQNDPGLLTILYPDNAIFDSLLLIDYQWAVTDRAQPSKPSQ